MWGLPLIMKVVPLLKQKGNVEEKMKKRPKAGEYWMMAVQTFVIFIGLSPYKINKVTGEVSFRWISCETIWSLIRLVVVNAPFSFLPIILAAIYGSGEWDPEEIHGYVNNTNAAAPIYHVVISVEYISCYSYFILPFLLAHATAKPLSGLMQILVRTQNKELGSSGVAEIFRPFVGFFLFFVGKLLLFCFIITMLNTASPGFLEKPFTMYGMLSLLVLSPLGLHFFLASQEFVFYSFSSFYRALAKCVLETSKVTRTAPTQPTAMQEHKNIAVYDAPGDTFHGNLKELIDLMKNMTEAFGPFLLQNFSLLLLYWLLHLYVLIYFVILTFRNAFIIYDPTLMSMSFLQFGGSILIVR